MKILHINSYLADRFFYNGLYQEQILNEDEIKVYVSIPAGGSHEAEKLGDHVVVKEDHEKWNKYLYFPKQNKIIQSIERTICVPEYEVLHAHSWYTNGYVAMKLAEKYNKPYIVAIRNGDVNKFYRKIFFLRAVGCAILVNAAKIVFLSETYRKMVVEELLPRKIREQIKGKSVVIPNGIDDFWFQKIYIGKRCIPSKTIRGIYVGEITKNKNVSATINALSVLKESGYDVSLTVIGEVKDKDEFALITECEFADYLEKRPKEQLMPEYRANDIFIMPSLTEAFGLVYAEAMSQGLPVLYTRGQGFDGHFADGHVGYAVSDLDERDLAAKIEMVINRYCEISANCLDGCQRFNWNLISRKYNIVYQKIMMGSSGR